MKIYFHKGFLLSILFFGIVAFFIGGNLLKEPNSLSGWIGFIISIGFVIIGIYASWHHRHDKELKAGSKKELMVIFEPEDISFPKAYYYKYSSIKPRQKLSSKDITEINLHTSPPSFVIHGNEVIFVPYKYKSALEDFGRRNNICITDRFDIWSAINEVFLDTEFDEDYKEKIFKSLEENGLSRDETSSIRKKIKFTMLSANSIAWEWVNLSQFDYLNWTCLTKEKYWWSMEIALRNYKKKNDPGNT